MRLLGFRSRELRWGRVIGISVMATALYGCPESVNTPAPPSQGTVSLSRDIQPIFNARCTSCHSPGFPTNTIVGIRMVLTPGDAFTSLVNQPSSQRPDLTLVEPGDAESSLLWLKVSSNNPPVGSTMPLFGSRLSSTELGLVRDWINQGALDN